MLGVVCGPSPPTYIVVFELPLFLPFVEVLDALPLLLDFLLELLLAGLYVHEDAGAGHGGLRICLRVQRVAHTLRSLLVLHRGGGAIRIRDAKEDKPPGERVSGGAIAVER